MALKEIVEAKIDLVEFRDIKTLCFIFGVLRINFRKFSTFKKLKKFIKPFSLCRNFDIFVLKMLDSSQLHQQKVIVIGKN